jgi:hypothetical protein
MATPQTASDILAEFPFLVSFEHLMGEMSCMMEQPVDTFI